MFFVPIVPQPHQPLSPRTRELAALLGRVIEEYEKYHPSVTGTEVRAAARLAIQRSSKKGAVPERLVAIGAGVLAILGAFVFLMARGGPAGVDAAPMVAVAIAVLLVLGLVVVLKRMGD